MITVEWNNSYLVYLCGGRITASTPAFQAGDEGSIPFHRSNAY